MPTFEFFTKETRTISMRNTKLATSGHIPAEIDLNPSKKTITARGPRPPMLSVAISYVLVKFESVTNAKHSKPSTANQISLLQY